MRIGFPWTVGGLIVLWAALGPELQAQQGARLSVEETGGIRSTRFPTRALIELPRGRLAATDPIRMMVGDTEVPAQDTSVLRWDDGSIRTLEVDFNVSIGPLETRTFELRYGPDVTEQAAIGRGRSVTEDPDAVQSGNIRFNKSGFPLLLSVDYRGELITAGQNGLTVIDDAGVRHDSSEIAWDSVELLKRGPLTVQLRYEGTLELGGGARADVVIDLEMPNSKSWLKISAFVSDLDLRVREIVLETPLRLGEYPWSWDFGTLNGTYGAFRDSTGSVILTQMIGGSGEGSWRVLTGPVGEERPYEESAVDSSEIVRGWAHLRNEAQAVAFAIEGVGETAGTFTAALTGQGQTSFGFAVAGPAAQHSLTVYQHFVATPVPIGAATSPASILSPLGVRVEPLPAGY